MFKDLITNWNEYFDDNKKKSKEDNKQYDMAYENHYIKNKNVLACLIGPSGSGKTTTIIEFLTRTCYKGYLPFFKIYYFTASTLDEDLLNGLKKVLNENITLIDDVNKMPKIEDFKNDKDDKKLKKLMIFDDINNLSKVKLKELIPWFNSGRKFISHIFCLNLNYISCPVEIRRNCNYFFIYKLNDNSTINYILRNHNMYNIDKDILKDVYKKSTMKKGDFLLIDLTDNSPMPFRHNFLDKINL